MRSCGAVVGNPGAEEPNSLVEIDEPAQWQHIDRARPASHRADAFDLERAGCKT
jgi:hypothetical protein